MNIYVEVFVRPCFKLLAYIHVSGIARLYVSSIFNPFEELLIPTVLQSSCTNLHFQMQCVRVPISLLEFVCLFVCFSYSHPALPVWLVMSDSLQPCGL